ncbi:sulfotransferase family protein [Arenimonas composti]|uniref:Sulfotransferase domain-containing protein n=1 Tax=Arenimonas composti TR7-09 = DSM 18010 TaxID=1121013 RepID=A0A091B896_9GAMM|nr:sulfotransferase [Arenimonas composti]KFN48873.1 hypothetical protein P873_13045 [Arenimonas composti TR7-09 = DSM 18010]
MTRAGPVYLIASERSGTNLLRKRITERQQVYVGPAPAQFLKHLYYREPYYGDLADDRNFAALVEDALQLCYVHFAPWKYRYTVAEVVAAFAGRPRDSVLLSDYLMQRYAGDAGRSGYLCKDNWLYEFALDIAARLPDARFIYLYRDPRDFVLSQTRRPGASRDVIEHARLWEYEQVRSIRVAAALGARCTRVSYEELIADEEATLARLCGFLGVELSAAAAKVDDNVVRPVHEWKNLDAATMKDNAGKFLREMGKADIARIEVTCALPMQYLGYTRATTRTRPVGRFEADWRRSFHGALKLLRRRGGGGPPVPERARLLRRLHVNYRNP